MARVVIGYGSKDGAKVVHAIVAGKAGQPLCDTRRNGYKVIPEVTVLECTCSKCLRYAAVKADMARAKQKPEKETPPPASAKPPDNAEAIGVPKGDVKKKKDEPKKTAPPPPKPKEEKQEEEREDFYKRRSNDGKYAILHMPSGQQFFSGIPESAVDIVAAYLNEIEQRWDKGEATPPTGFVSACLVAFKSAYEACGLAVPEKLAQVSTEKQKTKKAEKNKKKLLKTVDKLNTEMDQDHPIGKVIVTGKKEKLVYVGEVGQQLFGTKWVTVEKAKALKGLTSQLEPKRKIKRRKPKPKRKIKRRKVDVFGLTVGRIPSFVANSMLGDGITHAVLVRKLCEHLGWKANKSMRASAKITRTIRQLARDKGIQVHITFKGVRGEDLYRVDMPLAREKEVTKEDGS